MSVLYGFWRCKKRMSDFEYSESTKQVFSLSKNQALISRGVQETVEKPSYETGIPVARDVQTGEIIRIPLQSDTRVFTCAKSGQGKTVLGKAFLSRVQEIGGKVFCGSDIKNDFQSWNGSQGPGTGPSQELLDVTQGLLRGEEGRDFNRSLGIPVFLSKEYGSSEPSSFGTLFSIGFGDISEQDFKYLIGFEGIRSDAQRGIVEDLFAENQSKDLTWTVIKKRCDEEGGTGEKLWKRYLKPLKSKGVIGSKGSSLNSFLDFNQYDLCSLGLKGINAYTLGDMSKIRFYAAIVHRRVLEKRLNGGIDMNAPFVVYDDECHEIFPADESTPAKDEMALVFSRKGRQADMVSWLSSQEPQKVPSSQDKSPHDFISQTSHAFVGKGLNWPGYRTVFSAFSVYNSNDTQPLRSKKDRLDDHQFLYLDESMDSVGDIRIVESLAPLAPHPK